MECPEAMSARRTAESAASQLKPSDNEWVRLTRNAHPVDAEGSAAAAAASAKSASDFWTVKQLKALLELGGVDASGESAKSIPP